MNNPDLYNKSNEIQRRDAEQILKEYSNKLQWRSDGFDTLLDIGSGPGDVLMDFVYPIMPLTFKQVVGSDVSKHMMDFAKDLYKSKEKCDFRVLDIGNKIPEDLREQFDHITSFYCLHWIQNQRQCVQNIFDLLKTEGGDCLLVFVNRHPIFDTYKILCNSPKWSEYMKDVDLYISPYQFSTDPILEFSSLLKQVGFSDVQIELRELSHDYQNRKAFRDNFEAINPFVDRIPKSLQGDYIDDIVDTLISLNLTENKFETTYRLFIIYAKKPLPIA